MSIQNSPLVSVVIPAYNCAKYIGATLESVMAQSYKPLEVIVVDDGSTDGTADVVRKYPAVKLILQINGGLSNARNVAIRSATGDYIALLDGDDLWPPEKLTDQMAIIAEHPGTGLLFGNARRFSDDGWTEAPLFARYGLHQGYFGDRYWVVDPLRKLLKMNFIPVGTVVVLKAWLTEAGLFDERLRRVEDWDIWLRVCLNHPLAYSTRVWKLKRSHETNLSNNTEAMALSAISVMEKFRSENALQLSAMGVNVKPYLRDAYLNLGYFYLRELSLKQARDVLAKSLTLGARPRALLYWLSTFLGTQSVGAVLHSRG